MEMLGKRASPEVASTSDVALLVNSFTELELSRDGRKTLTAEVLKTLDEEVTFLVRSSVSRGKYYGCSWSKAMLEALDPSVWPLLDVHKAFRASRVLANVVVLAPLLALDDVEIALLHQGVLGKTRGSPMGPTDFMEATTSQLIHVELVASALKIEGMREAIDVVLTLRGAYAPKKRRQEMS
ncbi:hypothetical protein KFL_006730060 [Klebsormidium nitens]|uniref:Uncharacterized protein n=1 Tax=Klebsormidium nitens TaxID=105231 RepID=A0A1Y1IIG3_KLENI|nr:hypothetical protein KFL_006730060 [Klebsormidium nitens]|eukprot:GAQ90685.1 hypothetical protein KFL_006730060 [Klebsormidium nitens]